MPEGITVDETYRVMLVRLEGKIDLTNALLGRHATDIDDSRVRLNAHSDRLSKLELDRATRSGMAMLAKFLYGGVGAVLAATAAIVARHMGV